MGVAKRGHVQALAGQVEGVASLAGAELDHAAVARDRECLGGSEPGGSGVGALHVGVGVERGHPVLLPGGDGLGVDGLLK
jgi:hypothetical protein